MNTHNLSYIALSAALICISAWIVFPMGGIPVTMQTATICAVAALLGIKRALFAVVAYILLGAVGVPVFAGFTGGVAHLLSPTGGYIVGFLGLAAVVGGVSDGTGKVQKGRCIILFFSMLFGMLLCYAFGTFWFTVLAMGQGEAVGVWTALSVCVIPYIPFDILKIILSVFMVQKLRKIVKIKQAGMR